MVRKKRMVLYALIGICLSGSAVCGWSVWREMEPRMEAEHFYQEVRSQAFPSEGKEKRNAGNSAELDRGMPDWEVLKAWNPDICGWIYGPGTVIDYPIVQGEDNAWYLNHSIDQRESIVGSIFLESENSVDFGDDVSVIYGHHIRAGRMFSSLSGYKKQSYFEEHPWLYLYTPDAVYRVELFAGAVLDGKTGSFPAMFADKGERDRWLDGILAASTFQSTVRPEDEERILALCTCSYEYEDARYAVYGIMKKLEIDTDENRKENAG